MLKTYVNDFVRFNKTNEIGKGIALLALGFDSILIFILAVNAGVVTSVWWGLAVWFTVAAVVHFLVRPVVCAHYEKQGS